MGRGPAPFHPDDLLPFLQRLRCKGDLVVALSGGLDSTALLLGLHALGDRAGAPLRAVHANHGLSADADRWADHCRTLCRRLDIPLKVAPPPENGFGDGSPEERLRRWRYTVLQEEMDEDDVLCTGHHREDQAETVLLALMRGSGPDGLAAMPDERPLGLGRLARPLLTVPRAALAAFLESRDEGWIEDTSNADRNLDRNLLRHAILPRLRRRWPAVDDALGTTARLCAESAAQQAQDADLALAALCPCSGVITLGELTSQPAAMRQVLRRWLARSGAAPLPRARLVEVCAQLETASPDSRIQASWMNHTLRHYRGQLWLDSPADTPCVAHPQWDGSKPAELGSVAGRLALTGAAGRRCFTPAVRITSRNGGERFKRGRDGHSRALKAWFNSRRLPPWLRPTVPLIFDGDHLVAAGDAPLDAAFRARLEDAGLGLRWTPADPGLAWAWRRCRRAPLGVE